MDIADGGASWQTVDDLSRSFFEWSLCVGLFKMKKMVTGAINFQYLLTKSLVLLNLKYSSDICYNESAASIWLRSLYKEMWMSPFWDNKWLFLEAFFSKHFTCPMMVNTITALPVWSQSSSSCDILSSGFFQTTLFISINGQETFRYTVRFFSWCLFSKLVWLF